MCIKCSGGYKKNGEWVIGDGYTQRHTVPPPDPYDPITIARQKSRLHPPPVPVEHGTVRGIRSHRRKQEDLCDECDRYFKTDSYLKDLRQQSLDTVNRKLSKMAAWKAEGGDVDVEYRDYLERRRVKLEKQLFGDEEPAKKREETEPLERVHIRLAVRQMEALRERAKEEGVAVNVLVRQAVDAFLVL